MIPIEKCRKILEDNRETFTDKEIQEMRGFLENMAKIAIQKYQENKTVKDEQKLPKSRRLSES